MYYLRFEGKEYQNLNIKISVKAPFKTILNDMNKVELLKTDISQEHVRYAILELINNSLRAHRDKEEDRNILLKMRSKEDGIEIELIDWGGGFDLEELPYSLDQNYDEIDMQSPRFQSYRERFQYRRFGMGILSTKKVFPHFEILFHKDENVCEYKPGETSGTLIRLGVSIK